MSVGGWKQVFASVLVALLMAVLTNMVGDLATTSDDPIIGFAQHAAMVLIMPGLLGSVIFGSNIHAFSLTVAAVTNAVVYFFISWLVCRFWAKMKRRRQRQGE